MHLLHKVKAHKRHEISLHGVDGLLIVNWLSLLSPLMCILKLRLILRSINSLSVLSVTASISLSLLLVIISWLLLSLIVGDVIVAIGVLATKGGMGVKGNLIIVAVESVGKVVVGVDKFIGVSVDLKMDIAVLDAEGIVVAIDRERDGAIANVYSVLVARDVDVALPVFEVLLAAVVKDVHPTNYYTQIKVNYFVLERNCAYTCA